MLGRRTISRTICALGRSDQDWSADYKMFSRSLWQPEALFDPVLDGYLARYPEGQVVAAPAYAGAGQDGQAQVRSPRSVPRHPAFAVACYPDTSGQLAALNVLGPGRTSDYLHLPKWRGRAKRPSFFDMLTMVRKEYNETFAWPFLNRNFAQNLVLHANT